MRKITTIVTACVIGISFSVWGCTRREPLESVVLEVGGGHARAILAQGRQGAPGIVVLADTDLDAWTPLLSRWSARGWHGVAVTLRNTRFEAGNAPLWSVLCEAAIDRLGQRGADTGNLALVSEDILCAFSLSMASKLPAVQAVVMVSPVSAGIRWDPEKIIGEIRDCPTLVISSENDRTSDTMAERVKWVAPVFSEWRRYQGAERGVSILLSKPVAAWEMEDWLAAILEAPKPATGKAESS